MDIARACLAILVGTVLGCSVTEWTPAITPDATDATDVDAADTTADSPVDSAGDDGGTDPDVPATCDDVTCDVHATCNDSTGTPVCTCDEGWSGDGLACVDVDECTETPTICGHGSCTNNIGEYECECDEGYIFDLTTCVNLNECAIYPMLCNPGTCEDTDGGYTCNCPGGWEFDGTGCIEADPCLSDPGPCGPGTCESTGADYTCDCDPGYEFDGSTCIDIDECIVTPTICGAGTCVDSDGSYSCTCDPGYEFDGSTCIDIDECTVTPAICTPRTCTNTTGSYTCSCASGSTWNGIACVDIDECTDGTDGCAANEACLNFDGGYSCECLHGYVDAGTGCERGTVLVYSPNDRAAQDACLALGYDIIDSTSTSFASSYDAGGFDLIIVSAPGSIPTAEMEARLPGWVSSGGRLIFSTWDLDGSPALQAAFGVSTVEFTTPRSVYTDANRVDLFDQQSLLTSPLTPHGGDSWGDNGDALGLTGSGFTAGRFDSTAGPWAIAVTNGNRVIVNGFLFDDMETVDSDTDTIDDVQELVRNQINYLMSPRAIVHVGSGGALDVPAAVKRIGYTAIETTSAVAFATAYDSGGFELVIVAIPSGGWDSTVETRINSWASMAGPLVFSYWDLDGVSSTRTVLGVSTSELSTWRDVYSSTDGEASFFAMVESVPSPLTGTDNWGDNGDLLTLTGAGWLAGRFDSATGSGAIAVTNSDSTIVNGFMFDDARSTDNDGDTVLDALEILGNECHYLFLP